MAKIFVSYKYKDKNVYNYPYLKKYELTQDTDYQITARHYVNYLEELIWQEHIYKWEKDGESMAEFSDEMIDTKLKGKIFDSSVTIVLISPNMIDPNLSEKDQRIPNEISYSLRDNKKRWDKTSKTNAILAIILPDTKWKYDHAYVIWDCGVRTRQTYRFFDIIAKNMFNKKEKNLKQCSWCWKYHYYTNDHSYIFPVTWDDFIRNPNWYINYVLELKDKVDNFNLTETLDNKPSPPAFFSF